MGPSNPDPQNLSPAQNKAMSASVPNQNPMQPAAPLQPPSGQTLQKRSGRKMKGLLVGVLAAVFFLGGSAAAYIKLVHNNPQKIWERTMSSTVQGLDELLTLSNQESSPGVKVDGSFSVSSPIAADGSMSGQWYGATGSAEMDFGAAGFRVKGEMRTVPAGDAMTPDVYFKLNGLEAISSLVDSFGAGSPADPSANSASDIISQVNDQWYSIDRTLVDQLGASSSGTDVPEISEEDADKIIAGMTTVFRDTLLSTGDKAVFTVIEESGKEDFEGTGTYKFKVGVDKENLKNFLEELKTAMSDTKLADIFEEGTSLSYDELIDLEGILKDIDEADFTDVFADVWAEENGKYIRNIRIYPTENNKDANYIDIGIPYQADTDVIPFLVRLTVNESGAEGTLSFGADINKENMDSTLWFDVDMNIDGQKVSAKGELSIASTDEQVDVQKPEGAKNVLELVGGFSSLLYGDDTFDPNDPSLYDPSLFDDFDQSPLDFDSFPLDDLEI